MKILFEEEIKTYVNTTIKKIVGINGCAFLSAGEEETLPLIGGLPKKNNKILRAKIVVYEEEVERLGNTPDSLIASMDKKVADALGQNVGGECYELNKKSK